VAAAPVGTEVGISYDWRGPHSQAPQEGQFLRTTAGRCYLIVSLRAVRSKVEPSRFKIRALVIDEANVTPGERVYPLQWDKRPARSRA